jgi:hypothetical protein
VDELIHSEEADVLDMNNFDAAGNYIITITDANIEDKAPIYNATEEEVDDKPTYNN